MIGLVPGLILPTTVVGSYPVVPGRGLAGLFDPLRHAAKTAIEDQLLAGIDIISDGQVRGDMIRTFTSRLPGIRGQEVIGRVQPADHPITLSDTKYALTRHRLVKGIVTGPSTLAHGLRLATPMYRGREDLVMDLAAALAEEVAALAGAGVCVLQIDEPIFSTGAADLDVGREALRAIISRVHVPVCLHVCGDLGGIIDSLKKMPVGILDLEFSKNPGNREIMSGSDLGERMVGYGCVDSSDPAVESTAVIKERILGGIEIFGPEKLLIDPDCGLRMLTREAAFQKLSHMAAAARECRDGVA